MRVLAENHDDRNEDIDKEGWNCRDVPPSADKHQGDWQERPPADGEVLGQDGRSPGDFTRVDMGTRAAEQPEED